MNTKPEPELPLFDQPRARKTDPSTSHAAARRVKAGSVRHRILNAMEIHRDSYMCPSTAYPGAATFEIAHILGIGRDSVSPHMRPLKVMGYVFDTISSVKNPTTGNECTAWKLTQKYYDSGLKGGVKATTKPRQTNCPMCGKPL
jgi:hypothetical protein